MKSDEAEEKDTNGGALPPLHATLGSGVWVVACLLHKNGTMSQTLSWYYECESEDEAKGRAVSYALEAKPGFSIAEIITGRINYPNVEVTRGADRKGDMKQ